MDDTAIDKQRPRVCFVALGAYNVLSGRGDLLHIGGAEVQVVTLARALVRMGYDVSFITWDHGQPDAEQTGGILIHKICKTSDGVPILKFLYPRWTSLNAALARADADVYLQACADSLTGQVAWWCRRRGRPFVYVVMHDWDCRADLPKLKTRRERVLYRCGLKRAAAVVAQTRRQQGLLQEAWAIQSTIVHPAGGDLHDGQALAAFRAETPRVLWLGRFAPIKRLEWLLDVAARLPRTQFDLLGATNKDDDYARGIIRRAHSMPNVVLHGAVPHGEVDEHYRKSQCLLLTSIDEGFPSVYIEAWSWGLPTVTTVDVDDIISDHGLGATASSVDDLVVGLTLLCSTEQEWQTRSRNARDYYLAHHTPQAAARSFAEVIERVAGRGSAIEEA